MLAALAATVAAPGGERLGAEDFRPAAQHASLSENAQPLMRPVPKFGGTSVRDPHRTAQTAAATHALQWRTSSEIAPPRAMPSAPAAVPQAVVPQAAAPAVRMAARPTVASEPVRQVQFQSPQTPQVPQTTPSPQSAQPPAGGLQLPPGLDAPPTSDRPLPDFFADPFGERSEPTPGMPDAPATQTLPSPLTLPPPQAPQLPSEPQESAPPAQPVPLDPQPEQSPFDLRPMPMPGLEADQPRGDQPREIEDFEMPRRDDARRTAPVAPGEDETLIRPVAFSCDDFRRSIAESTIQKLSLDISPPFRPDVIELDEFRQLKQRFDERQEVRDWQSIDGRKLGRGRMRDLAYEKVIIETEFGTLEELPVNRISEADLAYVSSQWGLPKECLIEQKPYQERTWLASQVTWKASNLIHKPLYFEEVNLERYGHTAGPFVQPVVSSAHFFFNIAVLPYKMGVHLPHECQYALGYYRPGNCAPWIVPPVPLSLRGALFQATAMTGNGLLIP